MHGIMGCAHATATFHLHRLRPRLAGESGQGTVEYIGLILLLAAVMGIVATQYKGNGGNIAQTVVEKVKTAIETVDTTSKK
jgi:hypothetical protein